MLAQGCGGRLLNMAPKKKKKTQKKKTQKRKTSTPKPAVSKAAKKTVAAKSRTAAKAKTASRQTLATKGARATKRTASAKTSSPAKKGARKNSPGEKMRVFRSSLPTRGESQGPESKFEPKGLGGISAGQSGDLQGLSNIEGADSESVGELLEEGNAFEAEIVKGVQDAPDADQGEVTTHQRPQDELIDDFNER
jgi:hypothetical protein